MKLNLIGITGWVIASILLMTSCKKKNEQGRFIPANASVVVHMNAGSLTAKLPWSEIKQNEFFKSLYADSSLSDMAKSALDNPENTGVDIKKDFTFYMVRDTTGTYIAMIGSVKNAEKFKAYNTAVIKNGIASEQNGVQFIAKDGYVTSWDKDKFILVADMPAAGNLEKYREMMDEGDSMKIPELPETKRNMIPVAAAVYTLPEEKSLSENENFGEMVGNKGDVHFWMNAEALYDGVGDMGQMPIPMLNFTKLLHDSYTAATLNFENGYIKVDAKSYAGDEMIALWKKYSGSNISSSMVNRIPTKDVSVFFALNFKPEGIKAFLKMMGLDGLANMGLASLGFNLDDFVKANKGDIVFAMSGVRMDTTTMIVDTTGNKMEKVNKMHADFLFSASIGDKDAFNKLITAGNNFGQQPNMDIGSILAYNKNDKYFAIGTNKANVDQFVAKESNNKFAFMDKVSASPFAGYVDLHGLLTAFQPYAAKDSLGALAMNASLRIWDHIIISGGEFANGAVTQHAEINMLDKNTNSLKQLNAYTGQMALYAKAKSNNHKNSEWELNGKRQDSVIIKQQ